MREIEDVAVAFDRACRGARIDYAFIGGVAVMAWGQPRATMDVDALIRLDEEHAKTLADAARGEGLRVDPQDLVDAISEKSHATVFDTDSALHVDVKIASTPEEREEVANAHEVAFGDARLRIVAPEDTIAFKLKFGTPKDLADARSILVRRGDRLDRRRLQTLCARLKVTDRLASADGAIDAADGPDAGPRSGA